MAADELFSLNTNDRSILQQVIGWWRTNRKETAQPRKSEKTIRWTLIAYSTSDIAAASGDITSGGGLTPGTGTVHPCYFDGTVWKARGDTMTAHNISSTAVTANTPLQLKKINGIWVVDFEDCG